MAPSRLRERPAVVPLLAGGQASTVGCRPSQRRMPPLMPPKSGDALFASVERVNAELFTLTYIAIVRQLLADLEEVEEVNKQLDQIAPPNIPEVKITEDLVVNVARSLRYEINRAFASLRSAYS